MRRVSKTRKRISTLLLLAGIAGVGIWTWSKVRGDLFQRQANREFEEQTRSATQNPGVIPSPPQPDALIGRLMIPRLHLRAMVREGTDNRTLDVALGHVRGTAMPGAPGNVGIAGHRDTLFRCLRKISKGDRIVFQTTYANYTYSVENIEIVKPQDLAVLAPGSHSEITLVTCYPFYYVGAAPDRFIVRARLLATQQAGEPAPERRDRPAPRRQLLSRRFSTAGHSLAR